MFPDTWLLLEASAEPHSGDLIRNGHWPPSARALNMLAARFPSQNIVANAPQWAQTAMTNPPPRWCVEAPPRPTAPRTRYDALPPTSSFADVRAPSSDVRTPGTSALAPAGRLLTQPFPDQPDVWAPTPADGVAAYGAFIDSDGGGGATTTPLARCAWGHGPNTSTPHAGGYDAAVPVSVLGWPAWAGLATEAETTFAGFAPSHPSYNYAQDFPQQTQASPHQLLLPPSACAPPRSVPPIAFSQSLVEQPLLSTLAHSCPSAAFNALASDPPLPVPPMAVPPLLDYPPAIILRQHAAAGDPATAPPAIMNALVEPVPAPDIGYPAPAGEAHAPYGGALSGAEPPHFAYTEGAASPEATYYEPARLQDVYHDPAVVEAGLTVHAPVPQPIAASTRVGLSNNLLPVFAQTGPVEDVAYEPPRSIELPVVPAVAGVPTASSELFRIDGGSDGGSDDESDSSASSSARRKKRPRHRTQSTPSDRSSPTTDQPWSAVGSRPSTASTSDAASDLAPSSSKRAGRRTKQMHPCDKCHKSFDRPSTLEKHQEVHERLRQFTCTWCDYRFGVQSNLNRHRTRCKMRPLSPEEQAAAAEVAASAGPSAATAGQSRKGKGAARVPQLPAVVEADDSGVPKKRRRRAPPPPWVPASLANFDLTGAALQPAPLPLPPVQPYRVRAGDVVALRAGTHPDARRPDMEELVRRIAGLSVVGMPADEWLCEERDSYDERVDPERPYDPPVFTRLPGPKAIVEREILVSSAKDMRPVQRKLLRI